MKIQINLKDLVSNLNTHRKKTNLFLSPLYFKNKRLEKIRKNYPLNLFAINML
jgi:hypothetical protein